jgi:hypothetical protein
VTEFRGGQIQALIMEKFKLYTYFHVNGTLPPGNRADCLLRGSREIEVGLTADPGQSASKSTRGTLNRSTE